jgi:hypothetical protein
LTRRNCTTATNVVHPLYLSCLQQSNVNHNQPTVITNQFQVLVHVVVVLHSSSTVKFYLPYILTVTIAHRMTEEVAGPIVVDETWKEVRGLLKAAILAESIPVESKEMKPKEVFKKFVHIDTLDYKDKKTQEKFARMLRLLRSKQKNGDLADENLSTKPIEWAKSAAKQVLRGLFRDGTISTSFKEKSEIEQIWNDYCKDHRAFKRMKCDDAFVRRIQSVRDDHLKKMKRCEEDLKAFTAAKQNHPTPFLNKFGEPQWNGSEAQKHLKELIARNGHVGKAPAELWEANIEFQKYRKKAFRDHIYQEQRLQKFNNYVEQLKQKKIAALQY